MLRDLALKIAGKVHFIGIGGIGMSALALILKKINLPVQGSDLKPSSMIEKLKENDILCFSNHEAKNIDDDVKLVVKTSIIKDENPEIIAAKNKNIKIITRAQLLAQIMSYQKGITLAGTHGKTSSTALVGSILQQANLDPTIINGGIINQFDSNFKLGNGEFLIAESDESDGSFINLPSFIGAITNIEPEHLEFYDNDFEKVKQYYKKYVAQIPENGLCLICIDNLESKKIYEEFKHQKNIISYSICDESADILAKNIKFTNLNIVFDVFFKKNNVEIKNITLNSYGIHNVSNSLIAIGIADFLKIDENHVKNALKNFQGVKRRFSKAGQFNEIAIIDDYAHHPTEISALLSAAKNIISDKNKIILVLQPHKTSRVRALFDEFANCVQPAEIVILDDIYSVGGETDKNINQDSLLANIKKFGHKNAIKLENKSDLAKLIYENANSGDIILCAGAGSISVMAYKLENQLKQIEENLKIDKIKSQKNSVNA